MSFAADHLDLLLLASVCGALLLGFPVAFTLGGLALLFAGLGSLAGHDIALGALPLRIYGIVTNPTLLAVPLFIVMGLVLERSRIAEDLLISMGALLKRFPGGLAVSVTLVGALLAASTGIVGATVVTMALIALPTLLRNGYAPSFSSGSIAAAGTLGQIIPPSIVLVILSDQLSTAYQEAQRERGLFAPEPFSVADLFAAALIPGLVLVALYIAYQFGWSALHARDRSGSSIPDGDERTSNTVSSPSPPSLLVSLLAPLALILCVLGAILSGVAATTEAAALGAAGAIVLAGYRVSGRRLFLLAVPLGSAAALVVCTAVAGISGTAPVLAMAMSGLSVVFTVALFAGLGLNLWALYRAGELSPALDASVRMTAMVFAIMIGASLFALVFRELGGDETVHGLLSGLPGGSLGAVLVVMLVMFALGFFLDFLEIVFVVVPLVAPILLQMTMPGGTPISPAWLGVMMAINLQTSFLTPPFGFALFYLRGAAPDTLKTRDLYRGVMPFVAIQLLVLVVLWHVPGLATWLPAAMAG
ncbi:MAG: TRAP transporter large permease subunit [Roseibium sp.]|nr:TRAP transporter large permease subunit [Roseibium sp.]